MLNPNLPKYLAVAEWMKEKIYNNTFKAGEKLISENKLCEKFDISRQTARQAIAVLEEEGLIIKKQGSGTYVNPISLKAKLNTKTIAVILNSLSNPQITLALTEMERVFSEMGYQLTLRLTLNQVTKEREHLLALLKTDIAGLIVEGTKTALPNPNLDLYQQLLDQQLPLLFINHNYCELPCPFITPDHAACGQLATRHLIENGHQQIGGIFQFDSLKGSHFYKGFLTEMYAHHLPVDEKNLVWYGSEADEPLFSPAHLPHLVEKLTHFTAILCDSDEVALKLLQLLFATSLQIPQDLSLISLGNTSFSQLATPPLTSIDSSESNIGELAAHTLIELIEDPTKASIHHTCQPTLVIRQSVKKLA